KKEILKKDAAGVLSNIVLTLSIPALCVTAFLQDFNREILEEGFNLLIWSFVIHLLLMGAVGVFFFRHGKEKKTTLEILTAFGGVTVFGIPIAQALYGDTGIVYASIYCIAYRVFLYSYGYAKMADIHIRKENLLGIFLNPVIIITFISMGFWAFQDLMPQVIIGERSYSMFRIDKTMFWIFKPLSYLAGLCSPLAWLATGLKLSESSFKESLTSVDAWYYSLVKVILIPVLFYFIINNLSRGGFFPLSPLALRVAMIMLSTPAASVVIAYAIKYRKEPEIASKCSLVSTLISIGFLPFIIIFMR
ncbi:MAG: AEC family transporter, partial [Fusobacteriaceae bacterium]